MGAHWCSIQLYRRNVPVDDGPGMGIKYLYKTHGLVSIVFNARWDLWLSLMFWHLVVQVVLE